MLAQTESLRITASPVFVGIMATALVSGFTLSRFTQRATGLTRADKIALALGAFLGGMTGVKLPFVVLDPASLLSFTRWLESGKTIMTGLLGGYLGVEAVKWLRGITVKTGDGFAAPVALAVAIGRLACTVAPCCYGAPTGMPWAVTFPAVDLQPRHPTQLYEFAFHLTSAFVLMHLQFRSYFRHQLIKLYILAYLAFRFLTEFVRPEPRLAGGLTFYHWACLLLAPLFIFLWLRDEQAKREAATPLTSAPLAPAENP